MRAAARDLYGWNKMVEEIRADHAGRGHIFFTKPEANRIFWRAAAQKHSVQRAMFWRRLYREDLYGRSLFERRIREKVYSLIWAAHEDMRRLAARYGVGSGSYQSVLDTPRWGGYAASVSIEDVLKRRMEYWRRRGDARWEHYWSVRHDAVAYVRERWPLTPSALLRAERWRALQGAIKQQEQIEREARAERDLIERESENRRAQKLIRAEAENIVADLIPGFRSRRLMAKAKAFEVLIQRMEQSHVDPGTKEAIERLKRLVEGKRRTTSEVHRGAPQVAAGGDGSRH